MTCNVFYNVPKADISTGYRNVAHTEWHSKDEGTGTGKFIRIHDINLLALEFYI